MEVIHLITGKRVLNAPVTAPKKDNHRVNLENQDHPSGFQHFDKSHKRDWVTSYTFPFNMPTNGENGNENSFFVNPTIRLPTNTAEIDFNGLTTNLRVCGCGFTGISLQCCQQLFPLRVVRTATKFYIS